MPMEIIQERPERWWIADPIGHRAVVQSGPKPETINFLGSEVPVIYGPDLDLAEWVCDYCNASVPVTFEKDGEILPCLVPMKDNDALCPACFRALMNEEGLDRPSDWSDIFCACPPCTEMVEMMTERTSSDN